MISDWKSVLHQIKSITLVRFFGLKSHKMEKEYKITSAKHYEETMITIFELQEQEDPLTKAQLAEIDLMLKAAEKYEADEL
jgi:hypothetical protein